MSSVWLVTACGITRNGKKYQTEIHAGMHKTHHFEIKNAKIFWGGGHPSPDPIGAYGASIFAPTALKLNVTPPEKILVIALIIQFSINYKKKLA